MPDPIPEYVDIATGGLRGDVRGAWLTSDGLIYEGGAIISASDVSGMIGAEGRFFILGSPNVEVKGSVSISRGSSNQKSLAGKFLVGR